MDIDEARQKRILTTHVGSLPRPDALSEMMAEGTTNPTIFGKAVREAVAEIVRRQVDCGVDIVDDGEQSKPGFITDSRKYLALLVRPIWLSSGPIRLPRPFTWWHCPHCPLFQNSCSPLLALPVMRLVPLPPIERK